MLRPYSIRSGLGVTALLSLVSLAACGDQWSISKIQVNPPGPLGGNANISPLILTLPGNNPQISALVPLTVFVQRTGYNGPIALRVRILAPRPNQSTISLAQILPKGIASNANQATQPMLEVFCRIEGQGVALLIARPPATSASAPPTGAEVSFMRISGDFFASTSISVAVDSGRDINNFQISRDADKNFDVICRKPAPIN